MTSAVVPATKRARSLLNIIRFPHEEINNIRPFKAPMIGTKAIKIQKRITGIPAKKPHHGAMEDRYT